MTNFPTICKFCIALFCLFIMRPNVGIWLIHQCSGVTGGGDSPPDFWPRNFCWRIGRGKGKGVKIEKKKRKIVKGKVENWKWKQEKLSKVGRTFFFFFFFACHFWNRRKFVLGLPKWEFSTGKNISCQEKHYFAPSEKYACYAPASVAVPQGAWGIGGWDIFPLPTYVLSCPAK